MSCRFLRVLRPKSGIYVVNESALVADADVRAWAAACAKQIREHVAPAYGKTPVRVQFLSRTSHAPRGAWVLVVLDDADQAGALSYHSETADGRVYGRNFRHTRMSTNAGHLPVLRPLPRDHCMLQHPLRAIALALIAPASGKSLGEGIYPGRVSTAPGRKLADPRRRAGRTVPGFEQPGDDETDLDPRCAARNESPVHKMDAAIWRKKQIVRIHVCVK